MCADQNRRHPSKFAAAFSFWRWWDSVIVLVVLAIAVATGVVCRIQPKATGVEPDSPEAWRALLQSDVESERLAALILLASEGDKDATGRLIESLPRLSLDQLQTAIDVLVHLSGPERLRPELVAAFLTHPHADKDGFSVLVLDLIPKGKEREYVVPLCAFFDTVAQRYRTLSSDGIRASHTWETIVKIVATGDKDALRRCTKFLSEGNRDALFNATRYYRWQVGSALLTLYADDPLKGLTAIRTYFPKEIHDILEQGYIEKFGGNDGFLSRDWDKLGDEVRNQFSEWHRKELSLAHARYVETRDALRAFLRKADGYATDTVKYVRDSGKQKPISRLAVHDVLLEATLETTEPQRVRDIFRDLGRLGLLYIWGGIPPEVAKHARAIMEKSPQGTLDDSLRREILGFLLRFG